jgi:hypothetical protein
MTESAKTFTNFDRTECKADDAKTSSLGGDLMLCKSSTDIYRQQSSTSDLSFLPPSNDLLPRCEAPTHEKRGPVEVTIDEYGEMFEVKDSRGNTYTKAADGKWNRHFEIGGYKSDEVVENLKVDCQGNLTYEYNNDEKNVHVQYEQNIDGSWRYTNQFGKFVYDKDQQLVEAPAGEGHSRKFHYTNGVLDQIDGRLGHWDRVNENGKVSWVNKDTGVVWNGDFKMNLELLEFRGQNGSAWAFTPWGTDVNRNSDSK